MKISKHIFYTMIVCVAVVALGGRMFAAEAETVVYGVFHARDKNKQPVPSASEIEKKFTFIIAGKQPSCSELNVPVSELAGSKVHLLGCVDSNWGVNISYDGGPSYGSFPVDEKYANQPALIKNLPKNYKVKVSAVSGSSMELGANSRLVWVDVIVE